MICSIVFFPEDRKFIVADNETIYRYSAEKELIPTAEPAENLMVADSWLVSDGHVRALHLHQQRFTSSCTQLAGIKPDDITGFWHQAMQKLPEEGLWFPRIELAGNIRQPVLQLRIRKAPDIHQDIRLINCGLKDFRKKPRHKGPDLTELMTVRKVMMEQGADDAILTTPKGFLLEGLTTSLLWWEGKTLCTTPLSRRVLPGITCQLLRLIAEQENIAFACRFRKPATLNGCDVWAVNALHGIRRVVDWKHSPFRPSVQTDIEDWRKKLDQFMKKVF